MELIRALGALAELPGSEQVRLSELLGITAAPNRVDYTALFVLELPPFASIYLGVDGMMGGAVRDRVAGFWGALGQLPPAEPDHLASLLGLYAAIESREETQDDGGAFVLRHARKALFWEHVACWLPPYLLRAVELGAPSYRAWALLLLEAISAEAEAVGEPNVAPLHFRESPEPVDFDFASIEEFTTGVLAPARSGVIIGRSDLVRMARELDTGGRVGSRRFVLAALVQQVGDRAFDWLSVEATRQAALHASLPTGLQPVRDFWITRAERSAAAFARLAEGSPPRP